jgi:hypothetical protein
LIAVEVAILAVHITVNARWLNGPHREGAGSVGAAAVVRPALKWNSRRGVPQCSRPQIAHVALST